MKYFLMIVALFLCLPLAQAQDAQVNIGVLDDPRYLNPSDVDETAQGDAQFTVLNPYDPKYRPAQFPSLSTDQEGGIISRSGYAMHFVRPATATKNVATLRLSENLVIHGCADITTNAPKILMFGPVMNIETQEAKIVLNKTTDAPHYNCPQQSKTAVIDVPLNMNTIRKNNINQIVLRDKYGQDRYSVTRTKNTIELIPKGKPVLFKSNERIGMVTPLKHWFYPNAIAVLSAPYSDDIINSLKIFAREKNMIPLDEEYKSFIQPTKRNTLYVIDKDKKIMDKLLSNQTTPIGFLNVDDTIYGADGTQTANKRVQIMAKRPGFLE